MSNLLLIILNDISVLPELLDIWRKIGVSTTILESAGGHASHTWLSRVGLGAINKLFDTKEVQTRTLMAFIEEDDLLAQAIAEAERIVGGFDRPNSGMVMVLPVSKSIGTYKKPPETPKEVSPPALRADWSALRDTPVEVIESLLGLEATIVSANSSLDDVARAMVARPSVHIACVVAEDGRLIGLLELGELVDDLFFHILPEEFLTEITDLETLMTYAKKSKALTAADAMIPPVWVKRGETAADAFKRMHENKLSGLPLVDELYQVIGYINLLELLSLCIQSESITDLLEAK